MLPSGRETRRRSNHDESSNFDFFQRERTGTCYATCLGSYCPIVDATRVGFNEKQRVVGSYSASDKFSFRVALPREFTLGASSLRRFLASSVFAQSTGDKILLSR